MSVVRPPLTGICGHAANVHTYSTCILLLVRGTVRTYVALETIVWLAFRWLQAVPLSKVCDIRQSAAVSNNTQYHWFLIYKYVVWLILFYRPITLSQYIISCSVHSWQ